MKKQLLLASLSILFLGLSLSAQTNQSRIDSYMEQAIKDWNIPGAAIAIVKDGEVMLSKGYGIADMATGAKVSDKTLFAIASNTKAFISASIAKLVEEGKLSWEDKVVDHLPYFKMYDPFVTADFTVTDLLCHRSGLATFSGDLLWYGTDLTREEVIRNASMLEPVSDFRSTYGYQNIMFMAAGEVIEEVTGKPWFEYVFENFITPLGMDQTLFSTFQLGGTDHSAPHNDVKGVNVPIDWVNWDNMGPAGSLISNVDDLSKWMMLQLSKGSLDEMRYWSENSSNRMWTIHTPKGLSNWHRTNFPSKHFAGYGLGWDLFDYHGRLIANHGGGYDGFISQTVLVPEEQLGFVVLTNNNTFFPYAMMYHILDLYLSPETAKDWGAFMLDLKKKQEEATLKDEADLQASQVKGTKPSLPMSEYSGRYYDPKYGDVVISIKDKKLVFSFTPTPLFHGTLDHWHYDSFRLTWGEQHMLPKGMMTFVLDAEGKVDELKVDCPNPDLDFKELKLLRVRE
ncbi:MAG: serine hydrolase [Bacteroidetes bacterium]|nr:serine hydrolase [Bacteroidota bacterium]